MRRMTAFSNALATRVLALRWPVIALSLVCFALAAAGLARLHVDSDLRVFFDLRSQILPVTNNL